ncbi:transient receptor potential cation channel subfamily M member 2-like [Mytilus trossulus]|uniref:transient receptor potential cation channel subfamily M member 2-like n=1 Tax=Mytilus trossulus TaxID=6551 RepID=UPI0030063893
MDGDLAHIEYDYSQANHQTLSFEDGSEICIPVKKKTFETWEDEKPVAFLSIVGGTNQYLPNETIKNQLKNGLQEIMETTKIWIKTDGENTSVGKIVEEFAKEEKNLTHVFHEHSEKITNNKATHLGQLDYVLETCITDHLKIPIIMIIIGGDENSFVTAMTYLKMNYPVLVLEGSGRAADFICKGYRLSTFRTSEDKCVLSDTFISEITEAAKYIYGFNQEDRITEKRNCDKLAYKLKHALETRWTFIHVHSINDTTHSFDKAFQDILFQLVCKENKQDYEIIENILKYADLWDRPDIAEKEVFNLENSNLLQMIQGNKDSILSTLFKNALLDKKEEIVKQVLDYIQDREFFTVFLQQNLEELYVSEVSPDLQVVILAWSA